MQCNNSEIDDRLMTPLAFEFAISGLKLGKRTKATARLVHIDGLSRLEAREKTGMAVGTLNKALARIEKNLQEKLVAENLVMCNNITTPEFLSAAESNEALLLELRLGKMKKRLKSNPKT